MKLSIIIVNWNTRDMLRGCIEHVLKAVGSLSHEIVVVDNGSTDGSAEMIEQVFPSVRLFRNSENLGFSKASNQGMREAKGEILVLLNSDVMAPPASLQKLEEYLEADPSIAAVGPQLIDGFGHLQYCGGFAPSPITAFRHLVGVQSMMGGYSKGVNVRCKDTGVNREVDWLSGACLLIRREAVDDVGFLEESHFMYAEDTEYGLRLKDKGWKLYLVPSIRVLHYQGASSSTPADTPLLWMGGLFRIAAGRLSRAKYALFGLLMSAAFFERYLLVALFRLVSRREAPGVVSNKDARVYAMTAFRLSMHPRSYASEFSRMLIERRSRA